MCGIAGVLGPPERTSTLLPQMLQAITHRGPDDSGEYVGPELAFGTTRLAIIDLDGGHQPMWAPDDLVGIVHNGEIYNAHEINETLIAQGSKFTTQCDTETVLQLYQVSGHSNLRQMFQCLHGMFALAIYDIPRIRLVLARDPFGIKPLYYRLSAGGSLISFGSEIKSLLVDPECPRVFNHDARTALRANPWVRLKFDTSRRLENTRRG